MFLLIFFVSFTKRERNLLFFFFFNFHDFDCSFLWIKKIKFIMIFFVTIVTNNTFKSSCLVSFSFSFNIISRLIVFSISDQKSRFDSIFLTRLDHKLVVLSLVLHNFMKSISKSISWRNRTISLIISYFTLIICVN